MGLRGRRPGAPRTDGPGPPDAAGRLRPAVRPGRRHHRAVQLNLHTPDRDIALGGPDLADCTDGRPSRRWDVRALPAFLRPASASRRRRQRDRCGPGRGAHRRRHAVATVPPISGWPPTRSSSRSATTCGPGTRPGPASIPELRSQFEILETAIEALGVALWPMVELEADDALASAAVGGGGGPDGRAGDHLHARQGPGPVRASVSGSSNSTAGAGRSATKPASGPSSGSHPARSPTGSRWSGTRPTGSPGWPGGAGGRRRRCSPTTGASTMCPTASPTGILTCDRRSAGAAKLAERLAGERERAELFRVLATLRVERALLDRTCARSSGRARRRRFEEVCRALQGSGTGRARLRHMPARLTPLVSPWCRRPRRARSGTGVSSCAYVHESGLRSGRHRTNEVAWRNRSPCRWS